MSSNRTMPTSPSPLGATVTADGVQFGVWAPKARQIEVVIENGTVVRLDRGPGGVHSGLAAGLGPGARYRYRIDGEEAFPDPRSRFQPEGVHGPSEGIDPSTFAWTDEDWTGITMDRLIIYELHVGTFTPDGTFLALIEQLPELKRLGVTAIELMPVSDFPGRWNWGYDGVMPFAPSRAYGRPDDLRRLVDTAHGHGLAVLMDVVYNHLGPDGNYLRLYSDDYFTDRHQTPWGEAINYDGPNNRFVRDFVVDNAVSWIREFHIDGLRLDATDTIVHDGKVHILAEIQTAVHSATDRDVVVIAEESRNSVTTIRPADKGGFGLDAVWADDFHHALRVYLTGTREHYFADYEGTTDEIERAIAEGFVYQGQRSKVLGAPRGSKVTDEPATAFVFCIQNHDQVGNRPFGERLHHDISLDRYAVASALLLFLPQPPLLFMGQEFAASTPFLFFTDHNEELGRLVTEGRRNEFGGFRAFASESMRASIPDPQAESTFRSSRLRLEEREINAGIYALYRELLALRLNDPVLRVPDRQLTSPEPLGASALAVRRWVGTEHRLLIANFGAATTLHVSDSLALEDVQHGEWSLVLSTSEKRFGGSGYPAVISGSGNDRIIEVPARTAAIFATGSRR